MRARLLNYLLILITFCGILCAENDFLLKIGDKEFILPLYKIKNQEYTVAIDFFVSMGGQIKEIKDTNTLLISIKDKNIILSNDTNYFSLNGKLIQVCCNIIEKDKRWYIPFDLLKKVAESIFNTNYFWNPEDNLMIWGYDASKVLKINVENKEESEKIIFEGDFGNEYNVTEEESKINLLFISKDIIKPYFSMAINDGIIKDIQYKLIRNRGFYIITLQSNDVVYRIYESNKGKALIVEFAKEKKEEIPAAEEKGLGRVEEKKEQEKIEAEKRPVVSVIVIDPGHGGEETGAIGPKGSYEKDITLFIAKRLKKLIEEKLGIKVYLTRNQDKTLSLTERTAIANNLKADIFISIHANASYRKVASGAETYYLSLEATDEDSYAIAKEENKFIKNGDDNLNMILWDLVQTQHLQESSQLAEIVQEELNTDLNIKNRGVKQAPFRVLMGADMPAILIEIGFITNPKEEELLNDDNYQLMLSNSILRSIQRFIKLREQRFGTAQLK